jgi:hypothetical protein
MLSVPPPQNILESFAYKASISQFIPLTLKITAAAIRTTCCPLTSIPKKLCSSHNYVIMNMLYHIQMGSLQMSRYDEVMLY